VEYREGWFNIRKSNTEAYLRLIVECKSADMLAEWVSVLKNEIQ
jgi:phosphomannomutase